MENIKDIRAHLKSVEETLKITNAMYFIASAGLRRARQQLNDTLPYFGKITDTISDILYRTPALDHPYFDQRPEKQGAERHTGFIVVTGDKGLAGAYNHNVLKLAEERLEAAPAPTLFLVGQAGRAWFSHKNINIDGEFMYTAQDPTVARAQEISDIFLNLFSQGALDEVWIVYTKMVNAFVMEPTATKLLPVDRSLFPAGEAVAQRYNKLVNYVPSETAVMDRLIPAYLKGMIFGALVESFCSEQNARMTAMNSASKNARKMLEELNKTYNRVRQGAITQEITEIVGGAQAEGR